MQILLLGHIARCRHFIRAWVLVNLILGLSRLTILSNTLAAGAEATPKLSKDTASSSGVHRCARLRFTLYRPVAEINPKPSVTCSTLCETKFSEFDREMEHRFNLVSQSLMESSRAFRGDEAKLMTPFSSIPFVDDCEAIPSACYGEKLVFTDVDESYSGQQMHTSCSAQKFSAESCSSTRVLSCSCRVILVLPLVHYVAESTTSGRGPGAHVNGVRCSPEEIVMRLNEKSQINGWRARLGDPPGNILPRDCSEVDESWPDDQVCQCVGGGRNCPKRLVFTPDQIYASMPAGDLDFRSLLRLSEYNGLSLADHGKLERIGQRSVAEIKPEYPLLEILPYHFESQLAIAKPTATSTSSGSEVSDLDSLINFKLQEGSRMGTIAPLLKILFPRDIGPPCLVARGSCYSAERDLARINQLLMTAWRSEQTDRILTDAFEKSLTEMQQYLDREDSRQRTRWGSEFRRDSAGNVLWVEDSDRWIASDAHNSCNSLEDTLRNALCHLNRMFRLIHRVYNRLTDGMYELVLFHIIRLSLEENLRIRFLDVSPPEWPLPRPSAADAIPEIPTEEDINWTAIEELFFL